MDLLLSLNLLRIITKFKVIASNNKKLKMKKLRICMLSKCTWKTKVTILKIKSFKSHSIKFYPINKNNYWKKLIIANIIQKLYWNYLLYFARLLVVLRVTNSQNTRSWDNTCAVIWLYVFTNVTCLIAPNHLKCHNI